MIICSWRMGASNLKLILISSAWDCTTFYNFLSILKNLFFKEIISMQRKSGAQRCRYCHAMVSSWAMKHFDFRKLAGLWLGSEEVMLEFMDLRKPRVAQRSNIGLVNLAILWQNARLVHSEMLTLEYRNEHKYIYHRVSIFSGELDISDSYNRAWVI